jgi:hypothetical protein
MNGLDSFGLVCEQGLLCSQARAAARRTLQTVQFDLAYALGTQHADRSPSDSRRVVLAVGGGVSLALQPNETSAGTRPQSVGTTAQHLNCSRLRPVNEGV